MSYQVIALKWRPQRFADVVGQEHVTRTLQNAIREDRVPHAFLFTGGRGVGKTTTARILAKALVCERGPAPEPCNECRQCREVTAGSSIDVQEIDAASNTGVDNVRELRESISYAPASARFRIYIVDEVHMLSTGAFNAFLKTLEEPPPYAKFIFATTDVHKVPATIQSRCQRHDFRLLEARETVEQLGRIAVAEGVAISPAALAAVANAGEGSLRDAESLLDQVVAYCGREVRDEDVAAALGLPEERTLLAFCAGLLARRAADCLRIVDEVAAAGMDAKVFARETLEMLRHLAVLRAVPDPRGLVPVTAEALAELQRLAGGAEVGRLQSLFELFLRTESEIKTTTFPKMLLELAVLRAVRLEEVGELRGLIERLEALEARLGAGAPGGASPPPAAASRPSAKTRTPPAPAERPREARSAPEAGAASSPPVPSPEAVRPAQAPGAPAAGGEDLLARLVARVARERAMLAGILEHGRLLRAADGVLELGFAPEDRFFLDTAREPDNLSFLRGVAREILGGPAELRFATLAAGGGDDGGPRPPPPDTDRAKHLRHEALDHEAVRWAMEVFEAQVKDVRLEP